jgi:hypothetical protein
MRTVTSANLEVMATALGVKLLQPKATERDNQVVVKSAIFLFDAMGCDWMQPTAIAASMINCYCSLVDREESRIVRCRKPRSGIKEIAIFAKAADHCARFTVRGVVPSDVGVKEKVRCQAGGAPRQRTLRSARPLLPAITLLDCYGWLKKSSA